MKVRLDKWLWAARFFKTRPLAAEAVAGGKVQIQGARAKPGREVKEGDWLTIRKGPYEFTVRIKGLSIRRGPAPAAAELYEESEESRLAREAQAARHQAQAVIQPLPGGRPTKKNRRDLTRLGFD
ncbi:MAG: RNA-binding protein [Magnetococcales bacterium]|nr:RNA-binding protein [Magnetococcales bacterium]